MQLSLHGRMRFMSFISFVASDNDILPSVFSYIIAPRSRASVSLYFTSTVVFNVFISALNLVQKLKKSSFYNSC